MINKCARCGVNVEDATKCQKCYLFERRHPGVGRYTGDIKAGDRFKGVHGFVWDRERDLVVMYLEGSHADDKIARIPINQFRVRVTERVENDAGRLLFQREEA